MKQVFQRSLKSPDAILSMIIGLGVIVAIVFAVVRSVQTTTQQQKQEAAKKAEEQKQLESAKLPKEHIVKEGEYLWGISETYYKTGYNWVDISEENKLADPDYITVEQKLTIPDVKPRMPAGDITPEAASTTGPKHATYTIVSGDTLWDISMKEYETNGRYLDIAHNNAIPNPDLIYPDTILKLPQ